MKIALLAPANSIHTARWMISLRERGHDVILCTQHFPEHPTISAMKDDIYILKHKGHIGYFVNYFEAKRIIERFAPDIVNAHYASGYGTTASLINFRPTMLSVWGSDIFEFPSQSRFKLALLRWNLRRATRIASTSHIMAREVEKLQPTLSRPFITPFGVDITAFHPDEQRDANHITIGTIKTLDHRYGIDILIEAFAIVKSQIESTISPSIKVRLMIAGDGPDKAILVKQATASCPTDSVLFLGAVPHSEVPSWLNKFDIFVAASRQESFGVAVVEASACGLPVVVSDSGGLPEVVIDGETGFIVPNENPEKLAAAIKTLVLDRSLRQRMGMAGRQHAISEYGWGRSVDSMESAYIQTIAST